MEVTEFPEILDSPQKLYYRGNIALLYTECVAVIGTRKPSVLGLQKTRDIVLEYKDKTIISGLAFGIDAMAHETALLNHIPTIAVLPDPVEFVYPKTHILLAERIVQEGGLLLSEHEEKAGYYELTPRLMKRNRIITGIASLVVPVEYNRQKSGTLHAIQYARRQGKEIRNVL